MFEEFQEKKFNEYLNLVKFPESKINLFKLRNFRLPPFIINFFESSYHKSTITITKKEFANTLKKAIIFNINYIIKPKATILKFIFGDVETRPAEYLKQKLKYFQFYNYYISHIEDFINLNNPLFISKEQVELLINEINKKILLEIIDLPNGDTHRLNLIKLLYYYFLDLTENNPINIKLPKKILSVFFSDKGFNDIKKKIDGFFSDEIFIQEAIDLMKPVKKGEKKEASSKDEEEMDDRALKEIIDKAKTSLLNTDLSDKDIKQASSINPGQDKKTETEEPTNIIKDISGLKSEPSEQIELLDKQVELKSPSLINLDENIYSEDLRFQSQLDEAMKPALLDENEQRKQKMNDIFCEETYRKMIIKKIFHRDEKKFIETVLQILEASNWKEATNYIEKIFNLYKVNYYSAEAVKFVDLLESYFTRNSEKKNKKQGNE